MIEENQVGRSPSGPGCQPSASAASADATASSQSGIPNAFGALKAAIHADPDYAWGWHCNLAVPIMDATGLKHGLANSAAALIMCQLFDYDMSKHPHYDGPISAAQGYFEMRVEAERAEDASGMSAGTAETRSGSGLQPASPVGEAETPKS